MHLQDIRVGNNAMALLHGPEETNVETGCSVPNSCDPNPCGLGTCVDMWGDHRCQCPPGESLVVVEVVDGLALVWLSELIISVIVHLVN